MRATVHSSLSISLNKVLTVKIASLNEEARALGALVLMLRGKSKVASTRARRLDQIKTRDQLIILQYFSPGHMVPFLNFICSLRMSLLLK